MNLPVIVEARLAEAAGPSDPHRPSYIGPRFGQGQAIAAFAEERLAEAFIRSRKISAHQPNAAFRIVGTS